MPDKEVVVVNGAVAPSPGSGIIYNVTLANGHVVTSPDGWGSEPTNEYSDPSTCNQTYFHEPGTCAFCDGYYKANPGFKPVSYVTREANGWGGNLTPIVDDQQAAEEQAEWDKIFESHE